MPERAVCDAGPRHRWPAPASRSTNRRIGRAGASPGRRGQAPSAGQAVQACRGLPRGLRLGRLRVGALCGHETPRAEGEYSSGSGSRSSRFTLSSRPARSATTASVRGEPRWRWRLSAKVLRPWGIERQLQAGDGSRRIADVDERLSQHPQCGGGQPPAAGTVGGPASDACRCGRFVRQPRSSAPTDPALRR